MPASSYYDAAVLGTRFGSLLAGALLAKRGFRVLVLGQDEPSPTYLAGERRLPRAPFTFTGSSSPVVQRVLSELALNQVFRRRTIPLEPSGQVTLPRHRLDLWPDPAALDHEVQREFPEVRRPIEDFHRNAARLSEEFDKLTSRDLMWPPDTFLERREFAQATRHRFFEEQAESWDPLSEFPEEHPFRLVAQAPIRFGGRLDPEQHGGLGFMRLYASRLLHSCKIEGGYEWLESALFEKIRMCSGDVRPREKADAILERRGTTTGIRLAGSGEEIGCSFVLAGCDIERLLRLVPDRGAFEETFERVGEPITRGYRYTLNVVVDAAGIPEGMATDVFALRDPGRAPVGENLIHVETHPADEHGQRLLCIETLLPRRGVEDTPGYIEGARERVLTALGDLIPFIDRHIRIIDSPHDGRDIQNIRERTLTAAPEPWLRGPQTMVQVHGFPVRSTFGVCAMPVRTPIRRLLLCNDQVVPGLGVEGAFLAAWSAARVVTRSDRRKEWMRRGLWTKIEL